MIDRASESQNSELVIDIAHVYISPPSETTFNRKKDEKNSQVIYYRKRQCNVPNHLNASSLSITDLSSLIKIVVREGSASVGVLCAVTLAGWK